MIAEKEKTLEPCPFCGQSPITKVEVTQMGGNKDQISFSVYCPDCRYVAKIAHLVITSPDICHFSEVEEVMLKVIDKWNTRSIQWGGRLNNE